MKPEASLPAAGKGRVGRKEELRPEEDGQAEPEEIPLDQWPTKCIQYTQTFEVGTLPRPHLPRFVQIFCKIDFIDLEGRADSESVQKIIGQIKPKQLVIIHGSPASTRRLSEGCEKTKAVQVSVQVRANGPGPHFHPLPGRRDRPDHRDAHLPSDPQRPADVLSDLPAGEWAGRTHAALIGRCGTWS